MAIYVSGSLAFDRIMTFGGNLQDHVLMDKLHMLSVSFMVDSMDERRGGCAGNIAYTLALLGEKPIVVSAAGRDFTGYAAAWEKLGLSLEGIRRDSDVFTALCYITTDQNNNQITGFYPGAMSQPATYTFPDLDPARDWAIVSPGSVDDMRRLPGFFRENTEEGSYRRPPQSSWLCTGGRHRRSAGRPFLRRHTTDRWDRRGR